MGEWTLEGLNEHWNAGSAVESSNDKKQKGGWLPWDKRRGGGRQETRGVDLQELRNVALLCNHIRQPGQNTLTEDPGASIYSTFSTI